MSSRFGEGTCPFRYPSDPLKFIAWRHVMFWATAQDDFRSAFARDTGGRLYTPPKNGLEAMIDKACGAPTSDSDAMPDFIEWLNTTQWGDDEVEVQSLSPAPEDTPK